MRRAAAAALAGLWLFPASAFAGVPSADWRDLSDTDISPQGKAALSMDPDAWRHAESAHFIYHYQDAKAADTVWAHSETFYGWIKESLGVPEDAWKKKVHIFVFHDRAVWDAFALRAGPAIHPEAFTTGWELFLYRDPFWLAPQKTLAHELTHVVAFRFLDGPIPLFVNEGFAEYISYRAIAAKAGGNEYNVRVLQLLKEEEWIPLAELTSATTYPAGERVKVFYRESELLVRYLAVRYGPQKFYAFLKGLSSGERFEALLRSVYGLEQRDFEEEFRRFALTGK